ncbi:MAG: hypothetical protein RLZZ505_2344 [Verrucomicrobiota bacterium]
MKLLGYRRLGWTTRLSPPLVLRYFEKRYQPLFRAAYAVDIAEDLPWPLLYKELDEHFPNARFVLTTRLTEEKWLKSISNHIKGDYIGHKLLYGYYHPRENSDAFLEKYRSHNEAVRQHFKGRPEKLLEMCFEEGDGWEKLCPFLGLHTIPQFPFPHSNKAKENKEEVKEEPVAEQ